MTNKKVTLYLVLSWWGLEEVVAADPPRNTGLRQVFVDRKDKTETGNDKQR